MKTLNNWQVIESRVVKKKQITQKIFEKILFVVPSYSWYTRRKEKKVRWTYVNNIFAIKRNKEDA